MKSLFLWKSGPMRGLNGACRKVFVPSCTKPALSVHDTLVFVPSCTKPALSVHDTLVFVPSCTKPALFVHDHSYSVEESG
ncbi:MAG: hypothetical protein IJQ35_03215 [Bacteroidales bacterium]|nr:hypothetical protein [Bacteroidales bacterium]